MYEEPTMAADKDPVLHNERRPSQCIVKLCTNEDHEHIAAMAALERRVLCEQLGISGKSAGRMQWKPLCHKYGFCLKRLMLLSQVLCRMTWQLAGRCFVLYIDPAPRCAQPDV